MVLLEEDVHILPISHGKQHDEIVLLLLQSLSSLLI